MLSNTIVNRILRTFPAPFAYCFAYGSGVKRQAGYTDEALKQALTDLVFCVDDPLKWHEENLNANPSHYSAVKYFGPSFIASLQQYYGTPVYCNTLVPIEGAGRVKYSVIATSDLCNDLNNWTDLYIAGRLHKPVQTLVEPNSLEITEALKNNYRSALRVSLLQLPRTFTYENLFLQIARLSYHGDFRMVFGEKKDKVESIVTAQLESFFELYAPYLKELNNCIHLPCENGLSDKMIEQNQSHQILCEHIKQLPFHVWELMNNDNMQASLHSDTNDHSRSFASRLAADPNLPRIIAHALTQIVWESSLTQSLKNIPTAGVLKAAEYSWKKALKTFEKTK